MPENTKDSTKNPMNNSLTIRLHNHLNDTDSKFMEKEMSFRNKNNLFSSEPEFNKKKDETNKFKLSMKNFKNSASIKELNQKNKDAGFNLKLRDLRKDNFSNSLKSKVRKS